jgi:flagellar motor switch protein FliG
MKLNVDKLSGPQKAAILFLAMGEEFSTTFFKELDEADIKKIGKYMSEISYIPSDVLSTVMDEFLIRLSVKKETVPPLAIFHIYPSKSSSISSRGNILRLLH